MLLDNTQNSNGYGVGILFGLNRMDKEEKVEYSLKEQLVILEVHYIFLHTMKVIQLMLM